MKVGKWFWEKQRELDKEFEKNAILCDGDCGNCYLEKDMNYTCYGDNLCDKCMFTFMAEQESERHQP